MNLLPITTTTQPQRAPFGRCQYCGWPLPAPEAGARRRCTHCTRLEPVDKRHATPKA